MPFSLQLDAFRKKRSIREVQRQIDKAPARTCDIGEGNDKIQKQARTDNEVVCENSKTKKRFPGQVDKQDVQREPN